MKRMKAILLLFACALPAQVVHVANYSTHPFDGWKRCTVDVMPPHEAGQAADVRYVLGRQVGLDVRIIDLRLRLEPGEVRSVDLGQAAPWNFVRGPVPVDPEAFWGIPTIAGTRLLPVTAKPDGAGYLAHLRARTGAMLNTDVWLWWYPDQPAIAHGEVVVTASNPATPDMGAVIPQEFALRFGAADVLIPGASGVGPALLSQGEQIGDGQARSFPLVLVWREHLRAQQDWHTAGAAVSLGVAANGIANLWPTGNPTGATNPLNWTRQHWAGAVERLHNWQGGPLGVMANGTSTGAEEDQVFVGAECQQGTASLGAETVRYLVALGQSRRPCHHLELDGKHLDLNGHPDLAMWNGRAHWHTGVSPDQLGKPRGLTMHDTHGWIGPWREHWLMNTLAIAARLTGSPALQWQLQHQARIFLYQETVDPRFSTSGADAVRSVGWAGLVAMHLVHGLEDRSLARLIRERWHQRVLLIYVPGFEGQDIWSWTNDNRLAVATGHPTNTMPYQQMQGCGLLDYACAQIGPPQGRTLALVGCKGVLDSCYTQDSSGQWVFWEVAAYDPQTGVVGPLVEGAGAHRTGWFAGTWAVPGIAAVLSHEPGNERAMEIWQQQASGGGKWVPPGAR